MRENVKRLKTPFNRVAWSHGSPLEVRKANGSTGSKDHSHSDMYGTAGSNVVRSDAYLNIPSGTDRMSRDHTAWTLN